jgi:hypothetical protein
MAETDRLDGDSDWIEVDIVEIEETSGRLMWFRTVVSGILTISI